jgi:hypothetical protein
MAKRYFWIKLKTDFFSLPEIDFLLSQKNGAEYVVLYEMLCLLSANTGGKLAQEIGEIIVPFDIDKITREAKYFDRDTVTIAMNLYAKLGLLYQQDGDVLQIANFGEMVGSESDSAARVRKHRALQCNNIVTNNVTTDIRDKSIDNRDKIIEKEKEKKEEKTAPARHKYGEYNNVLLSDDDMEKLKTEFPNDYNKRIERLSAYIAQSGKTYKNHLATIRNWARRDNEKPETIPTKQASDDKPFISGDLSFL